MCDTELFTKNHYYNESYTYLKDGNTTHGSCRVHFPCPNCGEPKPYPKMSRDTFKGLAYTVAIFFLLWFILGLIAVVQHF